MAVSTEDDWVLNSLDRYERLHVFELQEPTLCMEWSRDNTAFYVAGFSHERHNELLKLLLPEKLLAVDKQTLLARRDFKIACGAMSKQPIHHIQCLEQAKNVVITSGLGSAVTVWGCDPGSPDLLVATGNIATPTSDMADPNKTELQISWSHAHPDILLTGSSLCTLQSLNLNTLKPTCQLGAGEPVDGLIHALQWLSQETDTFLTCSGRGELRVWDLRQPGGGPMKFSSDPTPRGPSIVAVKESLYAMAVCGHKCVCLSAVGCLQVYDLRGTSRTPLATSHLPTREKSCLHWRQITPPSRPCAQFSELSNELSVSGVGRGVTVYDITTWSHVVKDPSPIFTHTGHEADAPDCEVTVHSWHPSFHSMILSCDSGGIMHAWQWYSSRV